MTNPAPGLFSGAQTLASPKKKKADDKKRVEVEGLKVYAAICAVEKMVKTLKSVHETGIKQGDMTEFFVAEGLRLKERPDNFRGYEDNASASCELRERSSASALSEMEIELLKKYNIPVEEKTDQVETFVINPEYLSDEKLLKRISDILSKDKSVPADLFMKQTGNKTTVVSSEGIKQAFAQSEDVLRAVLPVLTTLAIKPKLEGENAAKEAFDIVKGIVGSTMEETEENTEGHVEKAVAKARRKSKEKK